MNKPVAIVTGAGSGIGRATAIFLGQNNYRVVLVGRKHDSLIATQREVPDSLPFAADVTDRNAVDQLIKASVDTFGRIDALINNAGHLEIAPVAEMTDAQWRSTIDTNLSSAFYLSRAVWPIFERQKSGVIVNLTSPAARDPFPGLGAYGAAKSALVTLTLALAREGQKIGVRAHAVSP